MKLKPFQQQITEALIFFIVFSLVSACGVKGRPSPPKEDLPIGYGSPSADAEHNNQKKIRKQP